MLNFLLRAAIRGPLMVIGTGAVLYVWQFAAQVMWSINYASCTAVMCIVKPRNAFNTFAFLEEMPYELFTYYWQGAVLIAMFMAAGYVLMRSWYWAKDVCESLEGKLAARKFVAITVKEASSKS